MITIKHYSTCQADYPEKPKDEKWQLTTRVPLGDGQVVVQCNDCGAFTIELEKKDASTN
jgi:hypothetical protein